MTKHFIHFSTSSSRKWMFLILIALAALAGIFWYVNQYIYQFRAVATGLDISLQPTQESYAVGDEVLVNLQAAGHEGSKPTGFDLYITYDSGTLCYKGDGQGSCFQDTGFSQLGTYFQDPLVENVEDIGDGKKQIHLLVITQDGSQNAVTFNLHFTALAPGNADVRFVSPTEIAGATTGDIVAEYTLPAEVFTTVPVQEVTSPTPTPSGTVTPSVSTSPSPTGGQTTPTTTVTTSSTIQLNVKLRFQGIVKQPIAGQEIMRVKTVLLSSDKTIREERVIDFTADGSGMWSGVMDVGNVPRDKTYQIYIKGPKHLSRRICESDPREPAPGFYKCTTPSITLTAGANTLDFTQIYQLAGDLPVQNGIVDAVDITFIRANFGSKEPVHTAQADLNLDGIVDTQDYTLVMVALGFKYDEQ